MLLAQRLACSCEFRGGNSFLLVLSGGAPSASPQVGDLAWAGSADGGMLCLFKVCVSEGHTSQDPRICGCQILHTSTVTPPQL